MNKELKGNIYNQYKLSFAIEKNFDQVIKASKVIRDKPERVNIKFETFDNKFSIHFIDSSIFKDAVTLIRMFYGYKY